MACQNTVRKSPTGTTVNMYCSEFWKDNKNVDTDKESGKQSAQKKSIIHK